jgi:hypothetical protein
MRATRPGDARADDRHLQRVAHRSATPSAMKGTARRPVGGNKFMTFFLKPWGMGTQPNECSRAVLAVSDLPTAKRLAD